MYPTVQHQGNQKLEWFTTIDCPITRKYIEMPFWSATFLFPKTKRTPLTNLPSPNFPLGTTQNIKHHQTSSNHQPPRYSLPFWAWDGMTSSGSSLDGAHHCLRPHRGPAANFDSSFVADAGLRLPQVSLVGVPRHWAMAARVKLNIAEMIQKLIKMEQDGTR